jgi:SAM-dependent methyltransferase
MAFFRPGPGPYALALAMTGVRLGERLLEIGSGTPDLFGTLALKTGLSGRAAAVADDRPGAEALKQAGVQAGVLVEVEVASPASLPYHDESFDVIVLDATETAIDNSLKWLAEAFRVLRAGGRLIVAERTGGFRLWRIFRAGSSSSRAQTVIRAIEINGYRPVRKIAERDGWRFTEGLKPRT